MSAPYNLTAPATVQENQGTFTVVVETASTPRVDQDFEFIVLATDITAMGGTDYQDFYKIFDFPRGQPRLNTN